MPLKDIADLLAGRCRYEQPQCHSASPFNTTLETWIKKEDSVPDVLKWISANSDDPVTEVAAQSLKSRLRPVQEYLPLAAKNHEDDVEYVHHLRVWTRRADAAIEMYRDLLPDWRAAWIEKQLGRIRKATNDARDNDVLAMRLAEDKAPAAAKLLKRVRAQRVEDQQAVRAVYKRMIRDDGRFDRRVEKLLKRVRLRGKRSKSQVPTYRAWAVEHLRPILDDFFETAESDLNDTESLHQFRIVGKKLRYAMELLSAAFGSELRSKAYPLLETLQDQLGEVNDHASALVRLGHWIEETKDSDRAKYLSELLKSEQGQLKESRRRFSAWWSADKRAELREVFEQVLGNGSTSRITA
jgi:CHAD domain-containing protein